MHYSKFKVKAPIHFNYQGASYTFSSDGVNLIDYLCFYILRVHSNTSSILISPLTSEPPPFMTTAFDDRSKLLVVVQQACQAQIQPRHRRKHTRSFPYLSPPQPRSSLPSLSTADAVTTNTDLDGDCSPETKLIMAQSKSSSLMTLCSVAELL